MIPLARSSGPLRHTPPCCPSGSLALAAAVAAQAGAGAVALLGRRRSRGHRAGHDGGALWRRGAFSCCCWGWAGGVRIRHDLRDVVSEWVFKAASWYVPGFVGLRAVARPGDVAPTPGQTSRRGCDGAVGRGDVVVKGSRVSQKCGTVCNDTTKSQRKKRKRKCMLICGAAQCGPA